MSDSDWLVCLLPIFHSFFHSNQWIVRFAFFNIFHTCEIMFSLKEIFFQPLKCQPNINTLRLYRNPNTGNQQIYLIGLDGLGVVIEYFSTTNDYKAYTISLQDSASKSLFQSNSIPFLSFIFKRIVEYWVWTSYQSRNTTHLQRLFMVMPKQQEFP